MAHVTRTRLLDTFAWAAGAKINKKIQSGMILRKLALRLVGTLTCTAAINTYANVQRGDLARLLERITLTANSTDTLRDYTGAEATVLNFLRGGLYRPNPLVGSGATETFSGTVAQIPVDEYIPFNFFDRTIKRPIQTALDTSQINDLRLETTCSSVDKPINDATGVVNSASSATAFTGNVEIHAYESDDDTGRFRRGSKAFISTTEKRRTATITGTGDIRIDLEQGPWYRGLWLNFNLAGTNNGSDNDVDIFGSTASSYIPNNIKVIGGATTFVDDYGAALWYDGMDHLNARLGFNRALTKPASGAFFAGTPYNTQINVAASTAGAYSRMFQSPNVDMRGWIYIPIVRDGYLSEGIDTSQLTSFQLVINAAAAANTGGGNTNVVVIPECYYAPPAGKM